MTKPWETDNCQAMRAHYAVYSIPQAAALWCGVPEDTVQKVVSECTQLSETGFGRSIWCHQDIPCIEPRSRAIAEAVAKGDLPRGREDGDTLPFEVQVAYERIHVLGRHLKEWMEKAFPNEKPAFLFDDIEQNTHSAISADAYRALTADRDALAARLETAKAEYRKLKAENTGLLSKCEDLELAVEKAKVPAERAEATYLNIIGALLDLMLTKSPGGQAHSVFSSQSAVIETLLSYYGEKPGISTRTLQDKFAQAKRNLSS